MTATSHILLTVAFVSSVLSALGSAFIICNWVLFSSMRIFFTKLIVCLSVANLFSSVAYTLSYASSLRPGFEDAGSPMCKAQAVLIITFEMSSVLWTVAIAWTLYTMVVLKAARIERQERWYHLGCWGVPATVAIVLLATEEVGPADDHDEWCWIAGLTPSSRWVQVGVFYMPLVVAFAVSVSVYLRVGRAFGQLAATGAVDAGKEWMVQLRLRLYLLVFVCVWAMPLVDRTVQLITGDSPFWLQLLHAATGGRVMARRPPAPPLLRPQQLTRRRTERRGGAGRERASVALASPRPRASARSTGAAQLARLRMQRQDVAAIPQRGEPPQAPAVVRPRPHREDRAGRRKRRGGDCAHARRRAVVLLGGLAAGRPAAAGRRTAGRGSCVISVDDVHVERFDVNRFYPKTPLSC